jgi:four helix bundle protein
MSTDSIRTRAGIRQLLDRTMEFAVATIKYCRELRSSPEGRNVAGQLVRSASSVAANYRAVRRARSRREFIAKLGLVVEECDEAHFWFELLHRLELGDRATRAALAKEADELTALLVVTRARARRGPSG